MVFKVFTSTSVSQFISFSSSSSYSSSFLFCPLKVEEDKKLLLKPFT